MKKGNEKIDELIKEALSEEEAEYYNQLEQQNFFQQYGDLFKGKFGWMTGVATLFIFAFIALIIFALVQFLETESMKDMMLYSLIMVVSFISISMLKIWHYMQMDKNAILREVKRLELQVAILVEKQKAG
ncbi:MAG: hypothetical protein ACJA0X_001014 [Cyclobacteriaceae bacterium]|jgi:hypothetical protein